MESAGQGTSENYQTDNHLELLKKHGKTFNFARVFLSSEIGNDAAVLYAFCRQIDDIADDTVDKNEAKRELDSIADALRDGDREHVLAANFLSLCVKHNIPPHFGQLLIKGVQMDLGKVAFGSDDELIQYAFYVAGVVGLMMAPILGAKKKGTPFAIDLGIGMQLTNIARDVLEDAHMGRRYIPGPWVDGLTSKDIKNIARTRKYDAQYYLVQSAVKRLLIMADVYYDSGLRGLRYLPFRSALGIGIAGTLYRHIGQKLRRNDCRFEEGRTVVGKPTKIILASFFTIKFLLKRFVSLFTSDSKLHNDDLHEHIQCLLK